MSTEPNIRNRVAGAVVLVSLAVIFLPLILDGKKKNQILESYIPEKPASEEIVLINIEDSNETDEQPNADGATDNNETSSETNTITIDAGEITADKAVEEPKPSAEEKTASKETTDIKEPVVTEKRNNRPNYTREGHLVKVGGFSSRENADKLVSKLKAANFRAYAKRGTVNNRPYFRVFVGPYLSKADAEKAAPELSKLAGITKPVIEAFDPLKHGQG